MTKPEAAETSSQLSGAEQGVPESEAKSAVPLTDDGVERLLCVMERSARQWQVIVYPALMAFMVLAAFGFYLIYSLTSDIHKMARSLDPNMGHHMARITDSMQKMTVTIDRMSDDMRALPPMLAHMEKLDGSVHNMVGSVHNIVAETQHMNHSMRAISYTNDRMRYDMNRMTNNVSKPMSMFNTFMPW